ncbi:Homoserine dehydrogenase [Corynebacterium capitovis DSM 44611]|uniref:homoserine dehydrogenase n=1 Tax=Corynebacterium capitovis TaxID=131081 RepID=UPI00037D80C7|nr:homoserine dehydrogenase [Corynebacterium capitovis]WKD57849.1 Homoserine dehydrogenase [Corynebacterium capitovis DSM 44611]
MTARYAEGRNGNYPGKGIGQEVGVAILGKGTVGSEVLRLISEFSENLENRIGGPIAVRGVAVSDVSKHQGSPGLENLQLTDDARSLIDRDDVEVVVELIGGIDYPRELVLQALNAGKSVVTANKALVAAHADELSRAANEAGVDLYYEAAVAAAIPVVGMLRRSLAGDQIQRISGIVNGTTNFILDAMATTGMSYEDALAEATRLGYAEADPTADVEGHDAASKAAILASMGFHTRVTYDDVYCEGITKITADDIAAARQSNETIKLLAICERLVDDTGATTGVNARVHPALVPNDHPLASVDKSYNAIFVEAEAAGRLMFYGNGAGGAPTASAVLGDLVGAARNKIHGGRAPADNPYADYPVVEFGEVLTRYHINMTVNDRVGVLSDLAREFAEAGVSLSAVRQEESGDGAHLIVVTHEAAEKDLRRIVENLSEHRDVQAVDSVIRLDA